MATGAPKPKLVFFLSESSGRCRRVEAFLAQVLQRRGNHETFSMYRVDVEAEPDLASRFGVKSVPALAVVEGKKVKSTLESPEGCRDIELFLAPWLK